MAELEFLKGSYSNLGKVPIKEGQLIFTTGEKNSIFLDTSNTTREEYSSIEVIKLKESAGTEVEVDGTKYDSISDVPSGSSIALSANYNEPIILTNKLLSLDLNNFDIKNDEACPIAISANAALTIKGKGTIECNKHGNASLANNGGELILDDGYIMRSIDEEGNGYYTLFNHGKVTINGGIIQCPGNYSSLIENGYRDYTSTDPNIGHVDGVNVAEPTLTVNGGTIINDYVTIKNDDGGIVTINNGNIYGYLYHVGKSLAITGGYFATRNGDINLQIKKFNDDVNAGTCYISGGVFESDNEVNIAADGNPLVEITGGCFNKKVPEQFIKAGYKQTFINGYYIIEKEEPSK